jgi:hypothetical protein|tara:strand:+ start:338 stop:727 length:390 start_codon:yes stop_codon:yes gene_type:complete
MASELRVNTLKDASGNNSIATSFVAGGSAKAWSNYSGSGTTFRDSFNCASATDNGTGDYTSSFTSNMNNDDYSASVGIRYDSGANAAYNGRSVELKTFATGSIRYVGQLGNASANDYDHTCPQIHGDLA